MTRKKVKLMWIENNTARKASLKKRRAGLVKKVSEITILCGVEAFIIIYGQDDLQPAVWPPPPEVNQLIMRFQNLSELDRCRKMVNQETYLKGKMGKIHDHLKKQAKMNKKMEMSDLLYQVHQDNGLHRLEQTKLSGLVWMVVEKLKEIRKRIEYIQQLPPFQPMVGSLLSSPFHPHEDSDETDEEDEGESGDHGRTNPTNGGISSDQWFAEIMNNLERDVAGCSNTKNDLRLPHPFDITGGNSGGQPDIRSHHRNDDIDRSKRLKSELHANDFNLMLLPHENDMIRGDGSNTDGTDLPSQLPNIPGGNNAGKNVEHSWLPLGFNLGRGGGGNTENSFHQGLSQESDGGGNSGGNNLDIWLPLINNTKTNIAEANHYDREDSEGDRDLELSLHPSRNVAGNNIGGNSFLELGLHRRDDSEGGASNASGNDLGLHRFFE